MALAAKSIDSTNVVLPEPEWPRSATLRMRAVVNVSMHNPPRGQALGRAGAVRRPSGSAILVAAPAGGNTGAGGAAESKRDSRFRGNDGERRRAGAAPYAARAWRSASAM